jgi:galactose mutarotase-like enzyme
MSKTVSISYGASNLAFDPKTALLCQWNCELEHGQVEEIFFQPYQQESAIPYWPGGGCPILLPWAGRVWLGNDMGQYTWKNLSAAMPIHGFAYVSEFNLVEHSQSEIEFKIKDSALTRTAYPWNFDASIRYVIAHRKLTISIKIHNKDRVDLGFAPGIHPFFKLDQIQNWTVSIPAKTAFEVTERGLAGKSRPIDIHSTSCISPELRSLILGDLSKNHAELRSADLGRSIRVSWDQSTSNYMVLWVDKQAGYFCLEPWSGLPDAIHNGHGLQVIQPGESRIFHYGIEVG